MFAYDIFNDITLISSNNNVDTTKALTDQLFFVIDTVSISTYVYIKLQILIMIYGNINIKLQIYIH